jgi:uncharacterized membrane protein
MIGIGFILLGLLYFIGHKKAMNSYCKAWNRQNMYKNTKLSWWEITAGIMFILIGIFNLACKYGKI